MIDQSLITAYLTNVPSSEGFSGLQSLPSLVGLDSSGTAARQPQTARMQPTLPQSTGAADMDLPAVQPMDWLFKKERIYLLAQFWQQVSRFFFACLLLLSTYICGDQFDMCIRKKWQSENAEITSHWWLEYDYTHVIQV